MGKYNGFDVQAMLNFMSEKADKIELSKLDSRKWRLFVLSVKHGEFEMEGTLFQITIKAFKPYLPYAESQRLEVQKLFNSCHGKPTRD
ncbi:hypothetical protein L1D19_05895 [Vibrio natriegens]|uniref:hypothetical protein n=1 Tax=Vibrio natriegens TaxID=691 RepID=UPI001EFC5398|nr:hypothetical protein [Vibrio natriegens]MCG9699664.1 hypothetical protein [Vibrio natriegens]